MGDSTPFGEWYTFDTTKENREGAEYRVNRL